MKLTSGGTVRLVLTGALAAAVVLTATPPASAAWLGPERQLTTNAAIQEWPELSGDLLVYSDHRNEREVGDPDDPDFLFDIRLRDLGTGADSNLTPHHTAQGHAAISGNRVVWNDAGWGSAPAGLWYHNVATGAHRRLPVAGGGEPKISGSRVCFERANRIRVYDIATDRERTVSPAGGSAGACDISGDIVVWQDFRSGLDFDVYAFDLATGQERRITTDPASQSLPKVAGDSVVWQDDRNGQLNSDIYRFDLVTGKEYPVSLAEGTQWFPNVGSGRIVWMDEREPSAGSEVYLYDVASGIETRVSDNPGWSGNPVVAGDRIVYSDNRSDGVLDLYQRRVTSTELTSTAPKVTDFAVPFEVTGRLTSAGDPVAGVPVRLEQEAAGTWSSVGEATSGADGGYVLPGPGLDVAGRFRVGFAGDASTPRAVSSEFAVKPRVQFDGPPTVPATEMKPGRITVTGAIEPAHADGGRQLVLKAYRRIDGKWALRKRITATTYTVTAEVSEYRARVTLGARGAWRLRVGHPEDARNATTHSPYVYVTVR